LYDSKTSKQFRAQGIGFPNVGENVDDWIDVLNRINKLAPNTNVIRIYELPTCAFDTACFEKFMLVADSLGIYVVVPGTGTQWGWLPGSASACDPQTASGCYKAGGVLGFGQTMIRQFNYPNTLAIVIGNEFDMQMAKFMPVLKAYARDLKKHMQWCNTEDTSPTKGSMRMIPLMYANSDDRGNSGVIPKADYMFCGSEDVSVDIFGLNIERWCDDAGGAGQYSTLNGIIKAKEYPGAFFFSEMGCSKTNVKGGTRTWTQVKGLFSNYPSVDGFAAYVYAGNKDFDMFDGNFANATEYKDGENFFDAMKEVGDEPTESTSVVTRPTCPSSILGNPMTSVDDVEAYDTGKAGLASSCPQPYKTSAGGKGVEIVV